MGNYVTEREPVATIAGIGVALVELLVVGLAVSDVIAGPLTAALVGLVAVLAPVGGALVARLYAWSGVSVDDVRQGAYRDGYAIGSGELEDQSEDPDR